MKKTTTLPRLGLAGLVLILGLALPRAAHAQITIGGGLNIDLAFPAPPPLVVVQPGIQIVPEMDQEVYFVGGWYWYHHDDGGWYRCRDWHGRHWAPVREGYVPVGLRRIPPGRYRHYYRDDDGHWRPHHDDEWHEWRGRHDDAERRAWWHEHRRDERIRAEQRAAWQEHVREDRERERAEWRQRQEERHDRGGPRGDDHHDHGDHGDHHEHR